MLLAPKARYGFRSVTQLDPLDFLLFAALIYEIAGDIERRRVSRARNVVFSYRVATGRDGQLFDPTIGYRSFLEECRRKLLDASYSYVAITDISDFYSRIYHHRLENSIRAATNHANHVSGLMHLLAGWNGSETFGIPVGNPPSRLLAEITLSNVDEALLGRGVEFVRFNDDYRIFARSHAEAYRCLAFLAEILFSMHGLTLQQQKTLVLPRELFSNQFLLLPREREFDALHQRFDALCVELGIDDPYAEIDYDSLSAEQRGIIDSMNLRGILGEEIGRGCEIDIPLVRFILGRLGQLGDDSVVDDIFGNLDKLHPVFPQVVGYIRSLRFLEASERFDIGRRFLDAYEDSILAELDYHKLWCLDLFASSADFNQAERFVRLLAEAQDEASRRKLILAMGRAGQAHWFQSQWRTVTNFPPWTRRAVLAGGSSMPADARRAWYRSMSSALDPLELSITRWASSSPFG